MILLLALPIQGVEGLVMLAADCLADYQKLKVLTGIALRAKLTDFVRYRCGEVVPFAAAKILDIKHLPDMHYLEIDGAGGSFFAWASPDKLSTRTQRQYVTTPLLPVSQ